MFFFLRDGRAILQRIFYYIPLNHEDEVRMLERFVSVTRATIKGTILISIIQGSLAGVGFYFAGIDGAAFWGAVMTILSVVPGIGATLVWVPTVIYPHGGPTWQAYRNSAGHLVCGRGRNRRQRPASILCRQGRRDSGPSYSY